MIALDDDVGWGPLGSRKREHSRDLVDKLRQSARVRRSVDIAGIALDDGHTLGPRLLRFAPSFETRAVSIRANAKFRDAAVPILARLLVITLV